MKLNSVVAQQNMTVVAFSAPRIKVDIVKLHIMDSISTARQVYLS